MRNQLQTTKKQFLGVLILTGVLMAVPATLFAEDVTFEKVLRTYEQSGYNFSWGSRAFEGATWLSSGDLVVTGGCKQDHSGGAFLFGNDGSYKGGGNTCSDTSSITLGCSEAGGCQMGTAVVERTDGSIVRLGQSRSFVRRSPVVYDVVPDGLSFVSRIFFSKSSDDYILPQGPERDWNAWASYYDPVVTSNDILVVKKGGDGYFPQLDRLVAFKLPEFDELWTKTPKGDVVGGINDLFIQTNTKNYPTELVVSRVTTDGLTEIDREPISGLWKSLWGTSALKRDPKDASIFAIETGTSPRDAKIVRYQADASGIQKIDERSIPSDLYGFDFAILGDYVAFGALGPRVLKGTQELTVEKPTALFDNGRWMGTISSVSLGKDGKLVVANGKNVLLYKIDGVGTGGPGPATTTPPTGVGLGGMSDILLFARSYLTLMQAVMGGGPSLSSKVFTGLGTSTDPALQNAFNQAIRIINAN